MKNKGFTLVELLAVIVILSTILIIAVPRIGSTIDHAQQQAFKNDVETMIETINLQYETEEKEYVDNNIVYPSYTFSNGAFTSSKTIKVDGDLPFSGSIYMNENEEIIVDKLISNNKRWCAIKTSSENEVRVGKIDDSEFNCMVE